MLTLVACTSPREHAAADRWAPGFTPPTTAEEVPLEDLVLDEDLDDFRVGGWFDRVHPCGRKVRRPRRVCIAANLDDPDDPVPPWWPKLRGRARAYSNDSGDWFDIGPTALESVTGGVLRFEIEHSTAGADDCVWRLRERDTDRLVFTAYDPRDGFDWCH